MAPRGNPLRNPELDPVEQRPLVSAVYSVIDDLGGHGGMRRVWLDPNLGLSLTLTLSWPNPEPSQGLQQRKKPCAWSGVADVADVVDVVRVLGVADALGGVEC